MKRYATFLILVSLSVAVVPSDRLHSAPSNSIAETEADSIVRWGDNFEIAPSTGAGDIGAIMGKPAMATDGTNFFVVWRDDRNFETNYWDIYGARITKDGVNLDPAGIPISTFANYDDYDSNQYTPSVAFDGENYMVVWTESRNPDFTIFDIYAARITPSGTVLDPGGKRLTTGSDALRMPSIVFDGTNYFIAWRTGRYEGFKVWGARITKNGQNIDGPTGFPISDGGKYPCVAYDGTNYMVVWHEAGAVSWDIRGARVTRGGIILDPGGFTICAEDSDQESASIAFSGTNYLVIWNDSMGRLGWSIRGARVSTNGTVLDTNSLTIADHALGATGASLIFNGTNYTVVYTADSGPDQFRLSDMFVCRVSPDGKALDGQSISVSTSYGHQSGTEICLLKDTYLVTWTEGLSAGRSWEGAVWGQLLRTQPGVQSTPLAPIPNPLYAGWEMVSNSPTTENLYAINAFGENNAWVVGENCVVVHYDGSTWNLATQLTGGRLFGLWGSSSADLWTTGWYTITYHYDGVAWLSTGYPGKIGFSIWGADAAHISSVGTEGTWLQYSRDTWNRYYETVATGVSVDLSSVWGTSSDNIYAVGEYGTILRYNGSQVTRLTNVPTIQRLNSIWGANASDIFAVGDFGTILHYDGISWQVQESGTDENLNAAWGFDGSHVYAVGLNGTILHYNGYIWSNERIDRQVNLYAVAGAGKYVWAAGELGTIFRKDTTAKLLTLAVNGNGRTIPPAGSYSYPAGSVVTVSAIPSEGWQFMSWSGSVYDPGLATTTLTMDADKTITAHFTQLYTLNITVIGNGTTSLGTGVIYWPPGMNVSITALPSSSSVFSHWNGDQIGSANPVTITMNGNKRITANFAPQGTTLIGAIQQHPSAYDGRKVNLNGEYRGWESGYGSPPIARSDWVLKDATGSIYVTGGSQNLRYPADVGQLTSVTGIVRVKKDQPYIEIPRHSLR